jgi:drug/metabolite transporter (DMT)-like permease
MIDLGLILIIISTIFTGLYSFLSKVVSKKNQNNYEFLFYNFFTSTIFFSIYYIFKNNFEWNFILIFFGILNGIFLLSLGFFKIKTLENIDAIIFFPIYKILTTLLVLIIGIVFFLEELTKNQQIGFFIGFLVPLFLINKKERKTQINFKKGIIYCFIVVIIVSLINLISKASAILSLNSDLYLLTLFLVATVLSYLGFKKNVKKKKKDNSMIKLGILGGLFIFIITTTYVYSLKLGDLGIYYLIQSFSILIPIFLSILVYKENLSFKKVLALVLTVLSLYFLV